MLNSDQAVVDAFKSKPELIKKSLHEVAAFFFIEGQLSYSSLVVIADAKYRFYRGQLSDEDRIRADVELEKLLKDKGAV